MACINCKEKKLKEMESKIKQLSSQGFDVNRIAALLNVSKSSVIETLASPVKENPTVKLASTPKKKTKK